METAFLRYMLSDGAGAAVVESAPATSGISLRIDWISLTSYANTEKACMFFGSNDNACAKTWGDYPTAAAAAADGAPLRGRSSPCCRTWYASESTSTNACSPWANSIRRR